MELSFHINHLDLNAVTGSGRLSGAIPPSGKPLIFRSSRRPNSSWFVNLKVARALGLTVPPTLLALADEIRS